jgi:hypothetical protein
MSTPSTGQSFAELLDRASVLVCAGPGGVGKTTTSAAIGLAAAQRGRRVVVVTIDPAKRLADAIGVTIAHEPSRVPGITGGEFWAVMLDTEATFDDLVRQNSSTWLVSVVKCGPVPPQSDSIDAEIVATVAPAARR